MQLFPGILQVDFLEKFAESSRKYLYPSLFFIKGILM